jgi:hypothetical protein
MKLALEALVQLDGIDTETECVTIDVDDVITALRQALETEPFEYWTAVEGWVKIDEVREHFDSVGCGTIYKSAGEGRSPLYTAPQKKEWVGLTDEERWEVVGKKWWDWEDSFDVEAFARAIEAKLKEKNL